MDTTRPRLIRADDGMIDASKITYVETIDKLLDDKFRFYVGSDNRVFLFTSEDRNNLEEVRRRLIDFVWPDALVFSADQEDLHPLTPSPAGTRKDCS